MATQDLAPGKDWEAGNAAPSLPEVHGSIQVPVGISMLRRLFAFFGPGYLIAVGYMDPGNWATDIAGGATYRYRLLFVIMAANLIAVFLQALSAKLGLATGKDLAQACRERYPRYVSIFLWFGAEIAIVACDLAEVLGAAIALNLLFHIHLIYGVILTGLDVLVVLALQNRGFRWIEALVITLIGVMVVIFSMEMFYTHPDWRAALIGFAPTKGIFTNPAELYIALGILGATVMPHNLYLHSSIVQTRRVHNNGSEIRKSIHAAIIDSTVALTVALFVNAAILIVAAAAFYDTGHRDISDIQNAFVMLKPIVGVTLAAPLFAVALLASGQNSTLTGTLAGQIVMEGFLRLKIKPWVSRMISRLLAIVPAALVIAHYGDNGSGPLLLFSQVILSIQLPFAVIPLIQITGDKKWMGEFTNTLPTKIIGWTTAAVITVLNIYIVVTSVHI